MLSVPRISVGLLLAAAAGLVLTPSPAVEVAAAEPAAPTESTPLASDTAMAAVIQANGGNLPQTGAQLWRALNKLGKFAQLPVPFSSVRLFSSLQAPRVVIAPNNKNLSQSEATGINFDGRLYLAANMEYAGKGYEPRVTSVEFISWNGSRRAYDFGFIENMGGRSQPNLQVVDGGKCFVCHKNRGPILGVRPWSNTTNDDILRYAIAKAMGVAGSKLPYDGPFALPKLVDGRQPVSRFDGMGVAMEEAPEVNDSVRRGATISLRRDMYSLLTRGADGRRALQILLEAIVEPGALTSDDHQVKQRVDATFSNSFIRFANSYYEMQRTQKLSTLIDIDPTRLLSASGVRPIPRTALQVSTVQMVNLVFVPGLATGNGSTWANPRPSGPSINARTTTLQFVTPEARAKKAEDDFRASLGDLMNYNEARAQGRSGLTTKQQPSNPHAFIRPLAVRPKRPSEVLNAHQLAETIGVTDGDRRFFAQSLASAIEHFPRPKPKASTLAKEIFASAPFKDFIAGGPMPDRDEFKDRFVEALNEVLTKRGIDAGFAPERSTYASGPRYDPKAVEEKENAIMPTSACLRCHQVAEYGKAIRFDLIPPLAFDPFDKLGREAWLRRTVDAKKKHDVLKRMMTRLATDADMPPEDAPEHDLFRVKQAASFAEVKQFLTVHLGRNKKP